jgi:tRNA A37 N6-isopentenylltransferase MiaA
MRFEQCTRRLMRVRSYGTSSFVKSWKYGTHHLCLQCELKEELKAVIERQLDKSTADKLLSAVQPLFEDRAPTTREHRSRKRPPSHRLRYVCDLCARFMNTYVMRACISNIHRYEHELLRSQRQWWVAAYAEPLHTP